MESLLRRLFKDTQDDFLDLQTGYVGPIMDLVSPQFSPACVVIDELVQLCASPETSSPASDYWGLFRDLVGGWSDKWLHRAQ
eukprot:9651982-Alexandrium_andersonii.AAC.1